MDYKEYNTIKNCITLDDYDTMLHMIGYETHSVKRGKYKAYRNHYVMMDTKQDIEGFAKMESFKLVKVSWASDTQVCMIVTEKGLDFIGLRENCKITMMK